MKQEFNNLMEQYLTGQLSASERQRFISLLEREDFAGYLEQWVGRLMREGSVDLEEDPAVKDLIYNRLKAEVLGDNEITTQQSAKTRVVPLYRRWRIAAAVILLIAIAGTIFLYRKPGGGKEVAAAEQPAPRKNVILKLSNGQELHLDNRRGSVLEQEALHVINDSGSLQYRGKAAIAEIHTLITPPGAHYKVQLPDGTDVWLNAASSIAYPTAFSQTDRKVSITGEVYFDVTPDKSRPFLVQVDSFTNIEVLGTSFNINAYTDEPDIVTTLAEGKIKLNRLQQEVILTPGQQASITGNKITVEDNVDTGLSGAWRSGVFRFHHTAADAVLRQLARWYDIEIIYEGAIPAVSVSGEINRKSSLAETLEVLNKLGLHVRTAGSRVIVAP